MLRIRETEEGIVFPIRVQPRASRTEICGCYGGSVKIRVAAPPFEGRANEECVIFLSRLFDISKSDLKVVSGEKSRNKEILISGISLDDLKSILKKQAIE